MPDDQPRITVITPSFNQVRFIERTICSVLDQNYDNLEYIIVDGGSCDGTLDIIERYQDDLAWWVSTYDAGQANAINKALGHATGQIIGCLDSDDVYTPHALHRVAERISQADQPLWLSGHCGQIDAEDHPLGQIAPTVRTNLEHLASPSPAPQLPQASSFFHADIFRRFGGFEEMLNYQFFLDYTCRLLAGGVRPVICDHVLAQHRLHATSKTSRDRTGSRDERYAVIERLRQGVVPAPAPTRSTAPRRRAA